MQSHAKTQRTQRNAKAAKFLFAPLREAYLSAEHDRKGEAG